MKNELIRLREKMREYGIDAYMIPTDDFHGSEYVGAHFKSREFISGFTGSAGTVVVLEQFAGLWTDGRYFLQAGQQLEGSGIDLFRSGEEGVPTIREFLKMNMKKGQTLGFDGRCVMSDQADTLVRELGKQDVKIETGYDLVGEIWAERPVLSKEPVWILEERYCGQSTEEKIAAVRKKMEEQDANLLLLASLDDICWFLNVRGNDVACTPVVLSYMLIGKKEITWYVQEECLTEPVKQKLKKEQINWKPYEQIYQDISLLDLRKKIMYQPSTINSALKNAIPSGMIQIKCDNPTTILKAIKNPIEVENERNAHIKDGVALAKFMYWLKTKAVEEGATELTAEQYLEDLRSELEDYKGPSFRSIIGYGTHGAIIHYGATPETDRPLERRGFLLSDTGGHYLQGTTDTTRTYVLGPLTEEEKHLYTAVLRGTINLAAAKFLPGCSGQSLDVLARTPLWDIGYDYNHGTGHGVGYLLNVHEGPNSFHFRAGKNARRTCVFEEGMITSDEPGVYLEGKFGVRLENLIVCQKEKAEGFEQFLSFETLTMVPFEKEAIVKEEMTEKEIKWLNAYHQEVYQKISPYLTKEEQSWLKEATNPL